MNQKQKEARAWNGICNAVDESNGDLTEFQKKCDELIKSIATWE